MDEKPKLSRKKMHKKDYRKNRDGFIEMEKGKLPDGSKKIRLGVIRNHPDYIPRSQLQEEPEDDGKRGAVTFAILKAYSPELTIYEVAKRAGLLTQMDDVRRILAYHKKKCKTMRDRIDSLVAQLEWKTGVKVVL